MCFSKKILSILSAMVISSSILSFNTSAETVNASTTPSGVGHTTFKNDWEEKWEAKLDIAGETVSVCALVGYDTWCQNEDYITDGWAPTGWSHYVKVKNNNGSEESKTYKGGYNTNKADYKHGSGTKFWIYVKV